MATLIKNGTLITTSEPFEADILVEDEKIVSIGKVDTSIPSVERVIAAILFINK